VSSPASEKLTVETCRERAKAFQAKAESEPRTDKKNLYLALADTWKAIADGLAILNPK
jgi:hypothetical protein